jgi:hypothetical protein
LTEGGDVVGAPEDGTFEFEPGLHNPGDVPSRYATDTLRWQQRRAEWELAWERRGEFRRRHRPVSASAPGHLFRGIDHREILRRYHMFFESPRDLPGAFWAGEEELTFDPPTNVAEFTYGDPVDSADGRPRTRIARSAGWFCTQVGEVEPTFYPFDPWFSSTEGVFSKGERVADMQQANAEYDAAKREWNECLERHRGRADGR